MAGGTHSYQWALHDSNQRNAQSYVAVFLRLFRLSHSPGVNVCFVATVNERPMLQYTACTLPALRNQVPRYEGTEIVSEIR
jgi:hypothetical protein